MCVYRNSRLQDQPVAVKMENVSFKKSNLAAEGLALRKLAERQGEGPSYFPKYYDNGLAPQIKGGHQYNFLVMEYFRYGIEEYLDLFYDGGLSFSEILVGMLRAI